MRVEAARLRTKVGFRKEHEDPDTLQQANAHIRVQGSGKDNKYR